MLKRFNNLGVEPGSPKHQNRSEVSRILCQTDGVCRRSAWSRTALSEAFCAAVPVGMRLPSCHGIGELRRVAKTVMPLYRDERCVLSVPPFFALSFSLFVSQGLSVCPSISAHESLLHSLSFSLSQVDSRSFTLSLTQSVTR